MASKFKRKHKFISKEAKREIRMKRTMSIVLAGLMLFSVFAIGLSYINTEKIEYNGFEFKENSVNGNAVLETKVDGKKVFIYTYPNSSMMIPSEGDLSIIQNKDLIFIVNPNSDLVALIDLMRYEYSQFSDNNFIPAADGVYNNSPYIHHFSCENATKEIPIIHFIESNESTNIKEENNCITINMYNEDAIYIRDRLAMTITGIAN